SSHVDRSVFINNSELNIESLIKNLKNMIMKKLSVLYITESSVSLSASSVSFSVTFLQSSIPVPVSDSLTSATSVSATLTSATSDFIISAFVTSSPCFKKILYRLNKSHLSAHILSFFLSTSRMIYYTKTMKDIHVFRNRNTDIILFYTYRCEAYTSYLR
ncbi:hypothetical protein BDDG_13324, partial [Blastomyces dermatitidis ATCC 18188]